MARVVLRGSASNLATAAILAGEPGKQPSYRSAFKRGRQAHYETLPASNFAINSTLSAIVRLDLGVGELATSMGRDEGQITSRAGATRPDTCRSAPRLTPSHETKALLLP